MDGGLRSEQKRHLRILKEGGGAERRKEKRQGVTMDPEGWMLTPLLALPFTVVQCLLHIYNARHTPLNEEPGTLRVRVEECTIDRWTGKKEAASGATHRAEAAR